MRIEQAFDRFAWAPRAGARPSRGLSVLHEETIVPASLDETFAFFSDAANLERLTPPWLNFRIRTPQPIAMAEGTEIEYRIVLYGLPIPWLTRIDVWEPGVRFVDRQVRGPYRWWHHEHRFEAADGGTRVIDHVEFVPRARLVSGPMVRRDVRRIFDYRKGRLPALFTELQGRQRK
jgi:ligand-binding SRPBCC domain-containing protein